MAEWLKAAVLKTAVGVSPTGGSNPSPSAWGGRIVGLVRPPAKRVPAN